VDHRCDETKLQKLVLEFGAVASSLCATRLTNYNSGVFDGCSPDDRNNHAIAVVGWGTEDGKDYWKIKNSWGSRWGENGFIKVNKCALLKSDLS
jgi:C1A family cysteine protease